MSFGYVVGCCFISTQVHVRNQPYGEKLKWQLFCFSCGRSSVGKWPAMVMSNTRGCAMKWILSAFAVIWLVGWIALCSQTLGFQPTFLGKVKGATILFFIWPIVVIAAANE